MENKQGTYLLLNCAKLEFSLIGAQILGAQMRIKLIYPCLFISS